MSAGLQDGRAVESYSSTGAARQQLDGPGPAPVGASSVEHSTQRRVGGFNRAFGREMRLAREARGWTLADVADRIPDGKLRTVRTWEVATRDVPLSRLVDWCAAVGVDLAEMVARAQRRLEAEQRALGLATDNQRVAAALEAFIEQQQWDPQHPERAAYEWLLERFRTT